MTARAGGESPDDEIALVMGRPKKPADPPAANKPASAEKKSKRKA